MKKMNWTVLLAMCVVFFAAPMAGATNTIQEKVTGDSTPYWSLDTRLGLIFDRSVQEIQGQDCKQDYYGGGPMVGVDLNYNWTELQAGLSGTVGEIIFGGQRYSLGATVGWHHNIASWLAFKSDVEVGAHVLNNFIDGGMFESVSDDSDFAILPYAGARLGLDAKVWPSAGLVLGLWGGAEIDLAKREYNRTISGSYTPTQQETYAVGGHRLSVGVNLGFEF